MGDRRAPRKRTTDIGRISKAWRMRGGLGVEHIGRAPGFVGKRDGPGRGKPEGRVEHTVSWWARDHDAGLMDLRLGGEEDRRAGGPDWAVHGPGVDRGCDRGRRARAQLEQGTGTPGRGRGCGLEIRSPS